MHSSLYASVYCKPRFKAFHLELHLYYKSLLRLGCYTMEISSSQIRRRKVFAGDWRMHSRWYCITVLWKFPLYCWNTSSCKGSTIVRYIPKAINFAMMSMDRPRSVLRYIYGYTVWLCRISELISTFTGRAKKWRLANVDKTAILTVGIMRRELTLLETDYVLFIHILLPQNKIDVQPSLFIWR